MQWGGTGKQAAWTRLFDHETIAYHLCNGERYFHSHKGCSRRSKRRGTRQPRGLSRGTFFPQLSAAPEALYVKGQKGVRALIVRMDGGGKA